jgi:hypothetical protein
MTPVTEHPLRCETCEKHTENQYMDFCKGYPMSKDDPTELVTFIRYHGCASHSASSDVLDEKIELLKLVEDELFKCIRFKGMEITAVNSLFARYIRELRQQTKER